MADTLTYRTLQRVMQAVLFVAALALLTSAFGYPIVGSDGWIHLNWLRQFGDLFAQGNLYPRWMPDSFAGFGSPSFYYYPPLPYWVAGIFDVLGVVSEIALYQVVAILFLIISGVSSYFLIKTVSGSKAAATVGSLLYCVLPYRFADLYLRNALGEHAAFAFVPVIILSIYHVSTRDDSRNEILLTMLLSAVGWAGIVLTNIPATIVMVYVSVVYLIVIKVWQPRCRRLLFAHVSGGIIALSAAAVYLLPLFALKGAISTQIMGGVNLHPGSNLSSGYALLDSLFDQKLRTLYLLLDLTFVFGAVLVFVRRSEIRNKSDAFNRATIFSVIVALALQVPYLLYPFWKVLPLMDLMQFTWRWDVWVTLGTAMMLSKMISSPGRVGLVYGMVIVTIVITGVAGWHFAHRTANDSIGFAPIAHAVMDAPEYLPSEVASDPEAAMKFFAKHTNDREIRVSNGSASIGKIDRQPFATNFEVRSISSADIVFDHAYFPTWHLKDDRGVEYPIRSDSLGRIVATITEGSRGYQLRIVKQNSERIGAWISAFGILGVLALAVLTMLSRKRVVSLPSQPT